MAHRFEHLDEPRDARRGDEVAEVGLERADRHVLAVFEDVAGAAQLGAVAHRRAGGVALQQADIARRQVRHLVRSRDRSPLTLLRRCQKALAATVVAQPDAADDAVDRVAGSHRVGEPLEHNDAGAACGQQAVGVTVKRAAAAAGRQRLERAKPDM